jgi:hypothetical protein
MPTARVIGRHIMGNSAVTCCISITGVGAMLAFGMAGAAHAQTFDMTFDAFRKALDAKIREDTTDKSHPDASTVRGCQKVQESYSCTFNDTGFRSSINHFKKLNLMNGSFTFTLRLEVETVGGNVSKIILAGDRGDPANLMQFIATVVNTMQVWDPTAGKGKGAMKAITDELGLLRGDGAQDIGKVRTDIKPYAQIDCLSQNSDVTTLVACRFSPRS